MVEEATPPRAERKGSPYSIWQKAEGIPLYRGAYIHEKGFSAGYGAAKYMSNNAPLMSISADCEKKLTPKVAGTLSVPFAGLVTPSTII